VAERVPADVTTPVRIRPRRLATLYALSLVLGCAHEPALAQVAEPTYAEPVPTAPAKVRRVDRDRSMMLHMASSWAAEAVKQGDMETFARARQSYERYLEQYPFGSYDEQYAHAELLLAMAGEASRSPDADDRQHARDYVHEAHEHFVRTLELNPEGEHTLAAASAQLQAMKNYLDYRDGPTIERACEVDGAGVCLPGGDYAPIEYSADTQQLLYAYEVYAKYVKDTKVRERPAILRQRAQILIQHNRFAEAEAALGQLIEDSAELDHAREHVAWAAIVLMDVLNVQRVNAQTPQQQLAANEAYEAWMEKLQVLGVLDQPQLEQLRARASDVLVAIAWRRAMAQDETEFGRCAAEFLALYDRFSEHAKASTWLWNAADCLEADGRSGEAVVVREALLVRHPQSEHAGDTRLRLAENYQAIARPEDAARNYETFAEGHASDERAPDALENAYLLRVGLGHAEQAQTDLRTFERLYRRKHVDRAAALFWSQHDLLETNKARRSHALEYLESYGLEGGVDRAVVAEAVIAQIDWHRSCDEPLLHDTCVTASARKFASQRKQCGLVVNTRFVEVHKRGAKLSAAAQARFDRVLELARKAEPPADDPKRLAAFRDAWAMAIVHKADQEFERALRAELPEGLEFYLDPRLKNSRVPSLERRYQEQAHQWQKSKARLLEFIVAQTERAEALEAQYAKVSETGSPGWMIAASSRVATLQHLFSDQLLRAVVPETITDREHIGAYCEALAQPARVFRERARAGYEACLARSIELQYANAFTRACEEELSWLDESYVFDDQELVDDELVTSSRIEHVGVLADPDY
jgi:hypothetical protein